MARVILAITQAPEPPVRLLLGSDAVWLAPQYAAAHAAEDAKWREVSLSTDLPGLGDFSQRARGQMVRPPHTPRLVSPERHELRREKGDPPMVIRDKLYIGGRWVDPSDHELLEIRSPHDQSVLGRVAQATDADIDRAVAVAREVFDHGPWPRTAPEQRQEIIRRLNTLREARADEVAAAISAENGSALWFTKMGQPFLTRQITGYLKAAQELGWEEVLEPSDPTAAYDTIVRREPIGVVAAVIPWNSPFSAATTKLVPALLAGNTVVLKVSPENSLSMMLLADLFTDAGIPEGVLSILPADRETSKHLIAHPDVDKIAFTGSKDPGSVGDRSWASAPCAVRRVPTAAIPWSPTRS